MRRSPRCSGSGADTSNSGVVGEPRQVSSRLRLTGASVAPWGLGRSACEWSRVRVSRRPSRTTYRRESPQCSQVAVAFCSTAATTVVRGVSSIALWLAYRMICWCADMADSARKAFTSFTVGRASRWYSAAMVCSASWAATSPSGWPPMPSASTNRPDSRV
ncbi:hypothetical protein D3C72_991620 [compost metagenome]